MLTQHKLQLIKRSNIEKKNFCIKFILDEKLNFNQILRIKSEEVLSDEDYNWINKNDRRFLSWSNKVLNKEVFNPCYILSNENLYLNLCLLIDLDLNSQIYNFFDNDNKITQKRKRLNEIKREWEIWYTLTHPFKEWLTQADILKKNRLKWCFEYLAKMNISLDFKNLPYEAIDNENELALHILMLIDSMSFNSQSEYIIFYQRLNKSFSQYKFRLSGNKKKEYHLPLTFSAKEKLERLSNLEGISQNKMLENLINQAFEENKEYFN